MVVENNGYIRTPWGIQKYHQSPKPRCAKAYFLFDLFQKQNLFAMHVKEFSFCRLERLLVPLSATHSIDCSLVITSLAPNLAKVIRHLVHFSKYMADEDITKSSDYSDLVPWVPKKPWDTTLSI